MSENTESLRREITASEAADAAWSSSQGLGVRCLLNLNERAGARNAFRDAYRSLYLEVPGRPITNGMIANRICTQYLEEAARRQQSEGMLREALTRLLSYAENEICPHEETHRGGAIWTICSSCGKAWADDEGGFVPDKEPVEFEIARAALDP